MCIHMSLGPFIRIATYEDASYLSYEHTRINGQFVHCRTLVATNVRTGVSSAKISLDLTEIDHLYECARASWTRLLSDQPIRVLCLFYKSGKLRSAILKAFVDIQKISRANENI